MDQGSGVGEQENNLTYAALSSIDNKLVGTNPSCEGTTRRRHLTQLLQPLLLLQVFLSPGRTGNDLRLFDREIYERSHRCSPECCYPRYVLSHAALNGIFIAP